MLTPDRSVPHLAPKWSLGDTWTIRYHVGEVRRGGGEYASMLVDEFDWVYTVVSHTPSLVTISCYTEAAWIWHLTYTPDGQLLKLESPIGEERAAADLGVPYLKSYYHPQEEGVAVWPRFPLEEDFGLDDSAHRQRSRTLDSELEVAVLRAGRRFDLDTVRTATMRWEEGRPWWSKMRIDMEFPNENGVGWYAPYTQLEGTVIAWPKNTP
jgi:hypothetical protein